MYFPHRTSIRTSAAIAFFLSTVAFGADLETPPLVLKADAFLPANLLAGNGFKVRERVENDGLVNTYELETKQYGTLKIEGTPTLFARIAEINALTKIAKIEESDAYKSAAEKGAKSPLKGAEALVEDPIGAVKGAATGIGRWMSDVGRSIISDDPNQAGVAKTALGQAAAKRAYAYEFGVDPYSSFQPLQKSLDDIAWAAAGGGLTMKVAFALIPGAVGIVVSAAGTTDSMRALVRDKSPAELDKINRGKLTAMGVPAAPADRFLANMRYSPQDKTILVGALDSLKDVKDRALYVAAAARVDDPAKAVFMRVRAQMIAEHHQRSKFARQFTEVGGTLFIRDGSGRLHGHFPIDYLANTQALVKKLDTVEGVLAQKKGARGGELWIGGTVPPGTRGLLTSKGWTVHDDQYRQLFAVVAP